MNFQGDYMKNPTESKDNIDILRIYIYNLIVLCKYFYMHLSLRIILGDIMQKPDPFLRTFQKQHIHN